MTSFDLAEVRGFAADLDHRFQRCEQGKGWDQPRREEILRDFATLCREFHEGVRAWGQAVFSGRTAFDHEVERVWREEGLRLHQRAVQALAQRKKTKSAAASPEATESLQSALLDLHRLLLDWVSPQLAVGPAARTNGSLDESLVSHGRKVLEKLPGLPAAWEPAVPSQGRRLRKTLKSQTRSDSSAG